MATPKKRTLGLKPGPLIRARVSTYISQGQIRVRLPRADSAASDTPTRRLQNKKFGQATRLARLTPPAVMNGLIEAVKGKPWFLYDWIISSIYARAFYITDENGVTYYPMGLAQDISKNLDVLGQVPGDTLYRGQTMWQRTPVGTPGQVLALLGTPPAPAWVPGQGPYMVAETTAVANVIDIQGLDFSSVRGVTLDWNSLQVSVNGASLRLQFYISGSLISAAYRYTLQSFSTSGANAANSSVSSSVILLHSGVGNASNARAQGQGYIGAPSVSGDKQIHLDTSAVFTTGNFERGMGVGALSNVGPITGFRITPSSGNITGGRLRIFGSPFPAQ